MTETPVYEGYRGIYTERAGEDARALAEILTAPPEMPLNAEELAEVRSYDEQLFTYEIIDGHTVEDILRTNRSEDVGAPLVFSEAFMRGDVDLSSLPQEARRSDFSNAAEVYSWFSRLTLNPEITTDVLLSLAKKSADYYRAVAANALENDEELPFESERVMPIVLDPYKTIEQAKHAGLLREYILQQRRQHIEGADGVNGAKRALLDVYLAKANGICVSSYIRMDYLDDQAAISGNMLLMQEAHGAVPRAVYEALKDDEKHDRLMKRFDYLMNGMGLDSEGRASAVSNKLFELNDINEKRKEDAPVFSEAETKRLKEVKLSPDTIRDIVSSVLDRAGMLSEEPSSTWTPTRRGRAADELFQVVENPGKVTFAVVGNTGVYKYPSKPRSIFDVLVVGGFHELTHINQVEADRKLGNVVRIASIKGRRSGMLREGGANSVQRDAELRLFGKSKPIALTYAKAYTALHESGSLYTAAQAFMAERLRLDPDANRTDAAAEAADRVLRLKRQGGYGSGALAYAEEGIFNEELRGTPPELVARATAISSFDLVDQVRLHRYGLLPKLDNNSIDWTKLILEEMTPYIDAALKTTG